MVRRRTYEGEVILKVEVNYTSRKELLQRLFAVTLVAANAGHNMNDVPGVEMLKITFDDVELEEGSPEDEQRSGDETTVDD